MSVITMGDNAMSELTLRTGTPDKHRQECLVFVRLKTGKVAIAIAQYIHSFTEEAEYFFFDGDWNDDEVDINRDEVPYAKSGWYEASLYEERLIAIRDEVIGWVPSGCLIAAAEESDVPCRCFIEGGE